MALAGSIAVADSKTRTQAAQPRLAYIDNIRWTIILLVLSMHASDTYSPFGNWYYTDRAAAGAGTILTFEIYQGFLQAFFMALLFFIAGVFAAPSLARKGPARFAKDRFVRLGLPTLLYMLVIGPLTQYYLSHTWGTGGFFHQWTVHLLDGEWLSNSGPMWFCFALLIFSLIYAALPARTAPQRDAPLPGAAAILAFIAVMAAATFATRIVAPDGTSILNMNPADFPSYILMFWAGILASRGRWLERISIARARAWGIGALAASMLPLAALLVRHLVYRIDGGYAGLTVNSGLRCLGEARGCAGMSFGLIALYRAAFDRRGKLAGFLSDNAFAVYVFHPPVLIALAIAFHGVSAPPLAKAAMLTLATALAMFIVVAPVLRRIPYLRGIL